MRKTALSYLKVLAAASLCSSFTPVVSASESSFSGNILEIALFMRTHLLLPVVVDPSLLNEKMLGKSFRIDAADGEKALSQLRAALQAEKLSMTKAGTNHWISREDVKVENFRVVDLILGARNYGALAGQLRTQLVGHERKDGFLAAINLMALQERQYGQSQKDIKQLTVRIRSIDFHLRTALSGSTLREPDPEKARALVMQKETLQREVVQKDGTMLAALNEALNSPPPELTSIYDSLPAVANQKLYSDYLATAFANYKLYVDASSALGFDTGPDELSSVVSFEESLRTLRNGVKAFADNYHKLLGQAGLTSAGNPSGVASSASLDAALQLFDVHGDRRQAVRRVIGEKIISQLDEQVRRFRAPHSALGELKPRSLCLYLLDDGAKEQFKQLSTTPSNAVLDTYDPTHDGRVGAVTALVAGSRDGATRTLSVELQPKSDKLKDSQPTIDNIFGSSEKQVSLHAADDRAFMDVSFKAAIKDSLDLIASRYSRDLFNSSVSIAFDSTTDIDVGGDSAGVALGLATLSSIKKIPLDKKLAVTGSVRRYGDVRPVGGIYQKGKAAFDDLCLVLLLPSQNMENLFYLVPKEILSRHVFTTSNFSQAAGAAQVGDDRENATAANAVQLYNFALLSSIRGNLDEALVFAEAANKIASFHFSSRLMAMLLRVAQVEPSMSPQVASLIKTVSTAQPAASVMAADRAGKGATIQGSTESSVTQSALDQILPDFVAEGISGSEAINKLAQELRKITGKPVNIVVRNREKTALATTDMHLSTSETRAGEVLQMICTLGDAEYTQDGDIIVVSPKGQ